MISVAAIDALLRKCIHIFLLFVSLRPSDTSARQGRLLLFSSLAILKNSCFPLVTCLGTLQAMHSLHDKLI